MRRFLRLVLLFVCALSGLMTPVPAGAVEGDRYWDNMAEILFERIGRAAGLPSDIVTAIVQDRAGFVWVGTPVGLARYDGFRFRVFQADSRDPAALPDGYVNALHVDRRGRLWVGTNNGGVARFVPETESFVRYPAGPGGLAHPTVYGFAEDAAGNVWVALRSGLARLDVTTGATENFKSQEGGAAGGLPNSIVTDLLFDRHGTLWVATDHGLVLRPAGQDGFTSAHAVLSLPSVPPGTAISVLFEDARGRIWIGTRTGIVVCHEPDTGIARSYDMARADGWVVDRPQVRAIQDLRVAGDTSDRIWITTDPGGLLELDADSGELRSFHHDPAIISSISSDAVRSMLRDRSGLIWVATLGGGLNVHNPANRGVLSIFSSPSHPDGPSEPQVRSVMAASDGKVWLGLETKGIDVLDPATRTHERLMTGGTPGQALPHANILAMTEDGPDTVWIGTQVGLARYSRATGQVRQVDLPGGLAGMPVYAILVRNGELWLASDGLVRFNPTTGAIARFRHDPEEPGTLADDRVRVLALAADGRVWAGTHRGLHLIDPDTGHVRRVQNRAWDWSSLAHDYVTGLIHDQRGRLWVGTLGGGVSILNSDPEDETYHFTTVSQRNGLPGDSVQAMTMDDAGQIWVSTEDGLARIDPETRAVRALGHDDGVGVQGTWIGSVARLAGGELLFGGREGVTLIRPRALRQWDFQPPLVITDARIDNEPIPAAGLNLSSSSAQDGRAHPATVTLMPGVRTLSVGFAALDYAGPAALRYSYTLAGFDKGWVEADAQSRSVTYTNLPPGNYVLNLRATNKEGIWGSARTLAVTVMPAWYQTGLARLGGLAIALLLLGLVIQARTAALRRQHRWLERLVAQRTQDLVNANAELEQLASMDALTGLLNRRRLEEAGSAEIDRARRYGRPLSLLLIDLDHFKQVNDTFGHNAGDAALRAAALRMIASVRTTDIVARYGGEELVVLLPETDAAEAAVVAERIRQSIGAEPVNAENGVVTLTASIGGAQYGPQDTNLAQLIDRADTALYRAKQNGRDRVVFCDAHLSMPHLQEQR